MYLDSGPVKGVLARPPTIHVNAHVYCIHVHSSYFSAVNIVQAY